MPEASELLCGNWAWDPALRELRYYERKGKGFKDEPEYVERLRPVVSVTWYRWSQTPVQTATGQAMPPRLSRVVAAYEGGGDLTVNEFERDCAEKIARAIAEAYGLEVRTEGAPGGRMGGNVPSPDDMGRLRYRSGRTEAVLDERGGQLMLSERGRLWGRKRRTFSTSDVRRVELDYDVRGPMEVYTVYAVAGPEEERVPVAAYQGFEGWAEPGEWRRFAEDLARRLGGELRVSPHVPS